MFQSTTVAGRRYLKIDTIQNTDITKDFPIVNEIGSGIQITIPVGIPTIPQFPEFWAVGFPNCKASVDPDVRIYPEM
jgi:hypothetical protein